MRNSSPIIAVIDDDEAVRDSLAMLFHSEGLTARQFSSALDFLDAFDVADRGCIVADVRMPGMTGIELLGKLRSKGISIPVILITGHGDIPMAVSALKAGAADFFEKPFDDNLLLASVRNALDADNANRNRLGDLVELQARVALLTAREREVMNLLVEGHPNKVVAGRYGISPRTVEVHRARILEKMKARNLSDLVRMSMRLSGEGRT